MSSFLVRENNVSLFGKADFSSLSEETLQYSWTSPSIGKNQSNFDAFVIIDFTKGIFTFLKTQYMVETEDDPDIINRIYNHKIEEIIKFLLKFSIEIPQYCVVSQDITLNFYNKYVNSAHRSRYHRESLPITNVLPNKTRNIVRDQLFMHSSSEEARIHALIPEHLMLRYNNSTNVSTTIESIDNLEDNAYRFPVKKNNVIYVNNSRFRHSIPYIQTDSIVNRGDGNSHVTQITQLPRTVERTQIKMIDKDIYDGLLMNCEEKMISGTYELGILRFEEPPCENIIELQDYIPELRAQIEVGGRKRKNKKSKKSKKQKKTLTNRTQKYKWYKLLKKDTL